MGKWTTEDVGGAIAILEDGKAIAHVVAVYSDERREAKKRAAMFAAAPDLLAALKKALNHPLVRIPGDLEIVMRAAISKATGGQDNG
jgi:hypothetical protein